MNDYQFEQMRKFYGGTEPTRRDAIMILEEYRPKRCQMVDGRLKGGFPDHTSDVGKSIDMAIDALQKQIPRVPIYEGDGIEGGEIVFDHWICPCCEREYEVDYDDYDFCPNCGQAIDWSEVVE